MKLLLICAVLGLFISPMASVHAATLKAGDLIKASGPALYYFASDGTRLVFPNEKTYFSWYTNFTNVKTVSDTELSAIMIGGNVTYRPGKHLVKITTDPKVYVVDANGTLRWITSETLAATLYGSNWAKNVHDIPDAFFVNYDIGAPILNASEYNMGAILNANRTIDPSAPVPTPIASYANPSGSCAIPNGAGAEDVSNPTTVVGTGSPSSCTSQAFEAAVQKGGIITFDCGSDPVTITLDHEIRLLNKVGPDKNGYRVIDGGGLVTLSGGGKHRILYQNACEESLGWLNDHCNSSAEPRLVVQNIAFRDGRATNANIGGAAIYSNGGSLKVVNSGFFNNEIVSTGPDVAGGAIYATLLHGPTYIINSTFGGNENDGNIGSNGGAIGGIFTSYHIMNSVLTHNKAIGNGMNPAQHGTPGGGSGGAIYTDGNSFTLNICGTDISQNISNELGGAIFYVANDIQGNISINKSTFSNNHTGNTAGPQPGVNKPGCYLQTTTSKISISETTFGE